MNTHLNILHLPKRTDRLENLMKELEEQEITDYTIIEGIENSLVFRDISNSHKKIIRLAKQQKISNCIVAEDDIKFTSKGAWEYFLSQIPKSYDIFFASLYEGKVDDNNRLLASEKQKDMLSGLTLYSISERFYDTFLNISDMNHLDKNIGVLADKYEFYVCPEFCAIQMNGFSDNKKTHCNYDHYMKGRKLFGVNS